MRFHNKAHGLIARPGKYTKKGHFLQVDDRVSLCYAAYSIQETTDSIEVAVIIPIEWGYEIKSPNAKDKLYVDINVM